MPEEKEGTHHDNYELTLPDGEILWTRISHPVNRTDYGPGMWADILRDQLQVSEATFWDCITKLSSLTAAAQSPRSVRPYRSASLLPSLVSALLKSK